MFCLRMPIGPVGSPQKYIFLVFPSTQFVFLFFIFIIYVFSVSRLLYLNLVVGKNNLLIKVYLDAVIIVKGQRQSIFVTYKYGHFALSVVVLLLLPV